MRIPTYEEIADAVCIAVPVVIFGIPLGFLAMFFVTLLAQALNRYL